MEPIFARHESGLLVPEEFKRLKETWTWDEWKVVERATKFLTSRRVALFFGCHRPACQRSPIERIQNLDGGFTLRCAHLDRIVRGPRG
jgi:hypothetical protein